MIYHSVAEILSSIAETRARFLGRVENLSDEQAALRAAPGSWSIAEIVEHLAVSEPRVRMLLEKLVGKAESDGHARGASGGGGARFPAPVSIAEQVERSRVEKYDAPEAIRPTGGASVKDSLARLREARAAVEQLRPRLERVDGRAVRFPHPAFGPLDLYQWLAFLGMHEERHLRQIESILEARQGEG